MVREKTNSNGLIVVLLVIMVILQASILFFMIKPVRRGVYQVLSPQQEQMQKDNKAMLEKLAKLTNLPKDNPVIAEVVDIDTLKAQNDVNKEVYKDAKNGDKVIAYKDKFIIYRPETNKIIYEGKSPAQIMQEQYIKELQAILPKVNSLVSDLDKNQVPQLSTVTDAEKFKAQNPDLFKDVQNGDKILAYKDRLIIYRPSDNTIVLDKKIENQTK